MIRKLLAVTAVTLFASTSVHAAEAFKQADVNADGALSMEEIATIFPDTPEDQFKAADADGNGELSEEEFAAAVPADGGTVKTN